MEYSWLNSPKVSVIFLKDQPLIAVIARAQRNDGQFFEKHMTVGAYEHVNQARGVVLDDLSSFLDESCGCRIVFYKSNRYAYGSKVVSVRCKMHTARWGSIR